MAVLPPPVIEIVEAIAVSGVCLVIYAYGDNGSDEKREQVTAVSVIAGYQEWWREVEAQWIVRCGDIPFHATDLECNPLRGDYEGKITHEEGKSMYRDLTGILAASPLEGIGIGFDLAAQNGVFPHIPRSFAYFRVFVQCLTHIALLGQKFEDVCDVTYDISRENEANAAQLYAALRECEDKFCRWLDPKVSFASWRDSARLQAVDLLAYDCQMTVPPSHPRKHCPAPWV